MPKRRSPLAAALLGLIVFGWGHLYVGRLSRLALVAAAYIFLIFFLGITGLLTSFVGVIIFLGLAVVLYLFALIDPVWVAFKSESLTPRWYNRWYAYPAWVVVVMLFSFAIREGRGPVLGLDIMRMRSESMAPLIRQNDFVAVDTKAFSRRGPSVGDFVVVQDDETGKSLLRQVLAVSNSSVEVGTMSGNRFHATIDQLKGRLTCIFWSADRSRIGALSPAVVEQTVSGTRED